MRKSEKDKQERVQFPIQFESRDELKEHLESRDMRHRFITPMILLCELRNRTIDRFSLTQAILKEFDDGEIQRALYSLDAKGLC